MKKVIRFESNDGGLFDSEEACKEYEFRKAMESRIYEELRYAEPEDIYNWILANTKGFKDDAGTIS